MNRKLTQGLSHGGGGAEPCWESAFASIVVVMPEFPAHFFVFRSRREGYETIIKSCRMGGEVERARRGEESGCPITEKE